MNKNGECKSNVTFSIKPPGPPKVWDVVELKIKTSETPIKFSIQEIPEDRYPELIELMCSDFIADEPLCKSLSKSFFRLVPFPLSNDEVGRQSYADKLEFVGISKT